MPPQLRHESRYVVSADFLEEVMDRRNTEGRWDENRSTNGILQQPAERISLLIHHNNSRALL